MWGLGFGVWGIGCRVLGLNRGGRRPVERVQESGVEGCGWRSGGREELGAVVKGTGCMAGV